jgi:hypothetical protein
LINPFPSGKILKIVPASNIPHDVVIPYKKVPSEIKLPKGALPIVLFAKSIKIV